MGGLILGIVVMAAVAGVAAAFVLPRWRVHIPGWLRWSLGSLFGLYLVGRGAVEVWMVTPSDPTKYRLDWGGPHLVGVLAVHAGPGVVILMAAAIYLVRRSAGRGGTDPALGPRRW